MVKGVRHNPREMVEQVASVLVELLKVNANFTGARLCLLLG